MIIDEDKIKEMLPSEFKFLSEDEIEHLYCLFDFCFKWFYRCIDGEIKHVKSYHNAFYFLVNELIGKLVSEYFGDTHVKSEVVREYNTGVFYLISDNFIKDGFKYSYLNNEIFNSLNLKKFNNNVSVLERIDNLDIKKEDLIKLKSDLKRMVVCDFICNCYDRAFRNFMVGFNSDRVKLMPIYDFEFSFKQGYSNYPNVFSFNFQNLSELEYIRNDVEFQKFLYMASDLDMREILEKFHDIYPIRLDKEEIIKYMYVVLNKQDEIRERRLIK